MVRGGKHRIGKGFVQGGRGLYFGSGGSSRSYEQKKEKQTPEEKLFSKIIYKTGHKSTYGEILSSILEKSFSEKTLNLLNNSKEMQSEIINLISTKTIPVLQQKDNLNNEFAKEAIIEDLSQKLQIAITALIAESKQQVVDIIDEKKPAETDNEKFEEEKEYLLNLLLDAAEIYPEDHNIEDLGEGWSFERQGNFFCFFNANSLESINTRIDVKDIQLLSQSDIKRYEILASLYKVLQVNVDALWDLRDEENKKEVTEKSESFHFNDLILLIETIRPKNDRAEVKQTFKDPITNKKVEFFWNSSFLNNPNAFFCKIGDKEKYPDSIEKLSAIFTPIELLIAQRAIASPDGVQEQTHPKLSEKLEKEETEESGSQKALCSRIQTLLPQLDIRQNIHHKKITFREDPNIKFLSWKIDYHRGAFHCSSNRCGNDQAMVFNKNHDTDFSNPRFGNIAELQSLLRTIEANIPQSEPEPTDNEGKEKTPASLSPKKKTKKFDESEIKETDLKKRLVALSLMVPKVPTIKPKLQTILLKENWKLTIFNNRFEFSSIIGNKVVVNIKSKLVVTNSSSNEQSEQTLIKKAYDFLKEELEEFEK